MRGDVDHGGIQRRNLQCIRVLPRAEDCHSGRVRDDFTVLEAVRSLDRFREVIQKTVEVKLKGKLGVVGILNS